jgi:hypothetical protein
VKVSVYNHLKKKDDFRILADKPCWYLITVPKSSQNISLYKFFIIIIYASAVRTGMLEDTGIQLKNKNIRKQFLEVPVPVQLLFPRKKGLEFCSYGCLVKCIVPFYFFILVASGSKCRALNKDPVLRKFVLILHENFFSNLCWTSY